MNARLNSILEEHPYLSLFAILLISSLAGITIEYLTNQRFEKAGFYSTLFIGLIGVIMIKVKRNKNSK